MNGDARMDIHCKPDLPGLRHTATSHPSYNIYLSTHIDINSEYRLCL